MTPVYLFCNCKPTMQMLSKDISSKKQQKKKPGKLMGVQET